MSPKNLSVSKNQKSAPPPLQQALQAVIEASVQMINERDKAQKDLVFATALLRSAKNELETDPHAEGYYSDLIHEISDFLKREQ